MNMAKRIAREGYSWITSATTGRRRPSRALSHASARPGATVSMPIHWKQVKATLKPERYNIRTGPDLLKKSKPWTDYGRSARSLAEAIENVLRSLDARSKSA